MHIYFMFKYLDVDSLYLACNLRKELYVSISFLMLQLFFFFLRNEIIIWDE